MTFKIPTWLRATKAVCRSFSRAWLQAEGVSTGQNCPSAPKKECRCSWMDRSVFCIKNSIEFTNVKCRLRVKALGLTRCSWQNDSAASNSRIVLVISLIQSECMACIPTVMPKCIYNVHSILHQDLNLMAVGRAVLCAPAGRGLPALPPRSPTQD